MAQDSITTLEPGLTLQELREIWSILDVEERAHGLSLLPRPDAEELFLELGAAEQAALLRIWSPVERRSWIRLLPPDDVADVLQEVPPEERAPLLGLLDVPTRNEVAGLFAYVEDQAGGLMSTRFARVRPDVTVDEAIAYLRKQARERPETVYYAYVLDEAQRLLGVVSLSDLFNAAGDKRVREVMTTEVETVSEGEDQEEVARRFARTDLIAIPVVDGERRVKGIVTIDDVVDVVQEEATEDVHKFGGMESLEEPYLRSSFLPMIRKRGGWLAALLLGEMLTTTVMARFEDEIAKAVVLAMFVPLIISSGGNSGSQASTLVIRAMALAEVRLRDWWRVVRREIASGLVLGTLLGTLGFLRVVVWQSISPIYGEHYLGVAITVFVSLVGVVTIGTISGSMLPFVLKRLGFDPASASAPFVATLVDVSGLVIYFTVASAILAGSLL